MLKKDNKAHSVKSENGNNLIKITDFYADNCAEQEYVEVNDEVLEFLVQKKREEKKLEMRDYRHLTPFGFDEMETAEMHSVYEKSAEDTYFAELQSMELYEVMGKLKLVCNYRVGDRVIIIYSGAMTMSIPPQISAIRIRKAPFNMCF